MKLLVASDLHLSHLSRPEASAVVNHLVDAAQGVDVVVLPGDLEGGYRLKDLLRRLATGGRHVILVPGNHEYYGSVPARVNANLRRIKTPRVHIVLEPWVVKIEGQRFVCGTGWFPDRRDEPVVADARQMMNDFYSIVGFEPWVYEQANHFRDMCRSTLGPGDVVVTHHLPSYRCVSPVYARHATNAFFVHPMDDLIEKQKPALWISGHSHDHMDIMLGDTRYVRNPRGYPSEAPRSWEPTVIDV